MSLDEALVVEDEKIYTSIMACVMNVMPKVVDLTCHCNFHEGTLRDVEKAYDYSTPHRYMSSRTLKK